MTGTKLKAKPIHKAKLVFKNVAVLDEDHERLRQIATEERRSMAQQLTWMIRKLSDSMFSVDTTPPGPG